MEMVEPKGVEVKAGGGGRVGIVIEVEAGGDGRAKSGGSESWGRWLRW